MERRRFTREFKVEAVKLERRTETLGLAPEPDAATCTTRIVSLEGRARS
jgi:hypothetical protein